MQDTFTYDKAGNRLTKNGQSYGYSANSDKLASDPQGNAYSFDRNGNQLQKRIGANGWTYEYDWDNQLKKATHSDGRELTFWYDPDGNRIRKTVIQNGQTTTTQYVVDAQQPYAQVVEELDTNGSVTAKYVYGHDLLKVSRGGEYYYFYDGLGSVRLVVAAADGGVRNRYSYEAYGTLLAGAEEREENTPNEYLFTGERVDADTGLVYLRARYYDTTTGRFTGADSLPGQVPDPVTLHRYLYSRGNPTNFIDPSGYFSIAQVNFAVFTGILLVNQYASLIGPDLAAQLLFLQLYDFQNNVRGAYTGVDPHTGEYLDDSQRVLIIGSLALDLGGGKLFKVLPGLVGRGALFKQSFRALRSEHSRLSAKAAAKAFEFIEEIDQFTLKNYGGAPVPGFGDPDMIVKLRTGATLRRDVTVFSGKVRNLWTVIGEKAAQTRGADVQQVFIQLDGAYNAADVEDVAQRRIADLKSKFGTDVYVRIVDEAGRDLFNTFAH